jgi:transposase
MHVAGEEDKRANGSDSALKRSRKEVKQLEESLRQQSDELEKARKEIGRLTRENEKLKKELSARRSPPKWAKPNKEDKQGKKKGPKFGHKPSTRSRPEKIDETMVVFPESCPSGGGELPFPSASQWHTHVQMDLPAPGKMQVTEFIVGRSYCRQCCKYHSGAGRISHSLYGPRLHAQVCYWKFDLGLTLPKIAKLLRDQYALEISTGQISEMISRAADKFASSYEDLKTSLLDQDHLHVDETGWRLNGKNAWLWSFSNTNLSFYTIDPTRAQGVVEEVLGEVFAGVLCSDFYGAYHKIECAKQKCWAHILRELHGLKEKYSKNLEIAYFASRLKDFFDRGKDLREKCAAGKNISGKLARLEEEAQEFSFRKFRHPELKRLAKRLIKYRAEMFVFIEKNLEPTNNNAEREIRPAVLMRKTSYGNRSERGKDSQAILMSMLRTATKRGVNFVEMATEHLAYAR